MSAADEENENRYFAVTTTNVAGEDGDVQAATGSFEFVAYPATAGSRSRYSDISDDEVAVRISRRDTGGSLVPSLVHADVGQRSDGSLDSIGAIPAALCGIREPAGSSLSSIAGQDAVTSGVDLSKEGMARDIGPLSPIAPGYSGGTADEGSPTNACLPGSGFNNAWPGVGDTQTTADIPAFSMSSSGSTSSSGSVSTGTVSLRAVGATAQHLMINLIYDTSVNSAPVAFKTALADAAQFFENNFANPITVNIDVGYGEIAGYPLGGALGESLSYLYGCSYSQIADAMRAEANTSAAATAAASLPTGDPTNGGQFWVTTAEAKALGLPGYGQGLDGYVGFSSTFVFDYNNNSGVTPGEVDFFGVAAHEISEVLGRQMMDGASNGYEPLDLFHYSAPGVHSFTGTQTGYFSIDSGTTNLDNFNTNPSGDFGDWASSVGTDAFLAFCPSGIINGVSSADLTLMYALGWTPILGTQQPRIHSFGDFTGDGKADILWRNANGDLDIWTMNGTTVTATTDLGIVSTGWSVAGIADFNGDGKADLLWRNTNGDLDIWTMNGTTVTATTDLGIVSTAWTALGLGDFNGDGKSDILWRNINGDLDIWTMNGTTVTATTDLGIVNTSWSVVAAADFNGDSKSDILWRNANGDLDIWTMSGTTVTATTELGIVNPSWSVVGLGDFNADGKSDILWRNTNGDLDIWTMNGTTVTATTDLGIVNTSWSVATVADVNGDGKSDILWRNTNGDADIWTMNGTTVSATTDLGIVATNWTIQKPVLAAGH